MEIGRIGDYGSFYNPSKVYDIKTVDLKTVQEQDQEKEQPISLASLQTKEAETGTGGNQSQAGKLADLENISLTFQQNESFDYIGQDKNILNLDVEQAISDMKKDSILQEYQYFVGSSQNIFQSQQTDDGIVIPKFY